MSSTLDTRGRRASLAAPQPRDALLGLATVAGIDIDGPLDAVPDPDGSILHARGLLHGLLGHRHHGPAESQLSDEDFAEARRHFEAALAAFERRRELFHTETDAWNEAWIPFELADLHSRHDDHEAALALCDLAERRETERIGRDRDEHLLHELLGGVARVRADIAWRLGDIDRAASEHALAVFRVCASEVLPPQATEQDTAALAGATSFRGGPDAYTALLAEEVRHRAASRVVELVESGRPEEGRELAEGLRRWWEPHWVPRVALPDLGGGTGRHPSMDELLPALFPAPFAPDAEDRDDYIRRARSLVGRVLDARTDLAR